MKLYIGNQLEKLVARLAHTLDQPLRSPLSREIVVVQSRGMARWTSFQIARLRGVCMDYEFPFPRTFVERTLRAFFPEMKETMEFSPGAMAWKIHAMLPELSRRKEFTAVRNYLAGDEELKAFQLSEKIAHLFDQYLVYRPEMILRWERDAAEKDWQAVLWRELAGKSGTMHTAAVSELLEERLARKPVEGTLPERVSILGVSSLPPLYMRLFFALARHCEVNLFSLHPSMEYFGHDLPPRLQARRDARAGAVPQTDIGNGNPLLSSLGKLNRDFVELRLELDERAGHILAEQPEEFVEPAGEEMLAVAQGDILHARGRGTTENPKKQVVAGDRTIRIHSCHSPMREVEVLYDQLLDLFQKDPTLKPRDIFVMAPDIGKYAPHIQAVFAFPEENARYIPFSVTDRKPRDESPMVATFLSLLALPGSRCTATEIFSLLDRTPVRSRFNFTDSDMDLARQWIAESGVRWGIDAAHRARFGLPEFEETTWRAGFRRLLLGYAMTGGNRAAFGGIVPYDDMEGSNAEVLGRFITAAEDIFEMVDELPGERPLAEWADALGAVLTRLFLAKTSEEVADLRFIQKALDQLREVAALTGGGRKAGFRAVRQFLAQLLDDTGQRGSFFTGGVTFCALKPMRSIPARVICLIGMDDEAFPRRAATPGFDLMARDRKCGDRSPRDDDRFSFLEALISARGHFYVSYTGRSIIDNGEIPPSVLVNELLDYMDQAFLFPGGVGARNFVTVEHRLHAFSHRYFDGSDAGLFSYSGANAAASKNLLEHRPPAAVVASETFPEPDASLRNLELRSLVDFFSNPVRYFLRHLLGIRFEEEEEMLEESELFDIDNYGSYHLKQELVAGRLNKNIPVSGEFAARGLLPLGGVGESLFNTMSGAAADFYKKLESELGDTSPGEPLAIDLRAGDFSLTGKIESIHGNRIVQFRCASLKPKDWLRAWINHLAKCATPGGSAETLLVGEDMVVKFAPVKNADEIIAGLLGIYWDGLRHPLPFFPQSSFAYAQGEVVPNPRGKTSSIDAARKKWDAGEWGKSSEKDDASHAFWFGGRDPLDADFKKLALEVFGPMLRNGVAVK